MQTHEVELAIGETVRIGDNLFTLVDIDGDDIAFRVDDVSSILPDGLIASAFPPAK